MTAGEESTDDCRIPFRAVIFDFDGVIADTEGFHFQTFRRILAEEGIDIGAGEAARRRFLGINDRAGFRKAFREAGRKLALETCRLLVERKSVYYRACLPEVRLFPGVKRLLSGLGGKLRLAIASGGRGAEIGAVLSAHGIRRHFGAVLSADEVARSKPAPDPYLKALGALRDLEKSAAGRSASAPRLKASDCLVVEDSIPGIRSARAAGMTCLAVAHTWPAKALAHADWVMEKLADVRAADILGNHRSREHNQA